MGPNCYEFLLARDAAPVFNLSSSLLSYSLFTRGSNTQTLLEYVVQLPIYHTLAAFYPFPNCLGHIILFRIHGLRTLFTLLDHRFSRLSWFPAAG